MKLQYLILLTILALSASADDYEGHVGEWEANFSIDFHPDGTVSGTYSYPRRPGVTYHLKGDNREEGKLNLNEFTGRNLSARCVLTKRVTESRIVWQGTMFNTDGRGPFEISFSRPQDSEIASPDDNIPLSPDTITVPHYWPFSHTALNAHIFGKVHFGSFGGEPAWGAIIFEGEEAELQFSGAGTDWEKRVLNGSILASGVLSLRDSDGAAWEFRETLDANRIEWRGTETRTGDELVISRPRKRDFLNDDYRVTPESCRWMYTRDPGQHAFYQAKVGRFAHVADEIVVKEIQEENGRASAVVFSRPGEEDQVFRFQPPRPLNRIPVVVGFPVNAKIDPQGRIKMIFSQMGPHAFRVDSLGMWELLMSPASNDSVVGDAPRIVIRPDFFDSSSSAPFVGWWIEEDIIEWNEEAAGPGVIELETISLDSVTPQNEDSRIIKPDIAEPPPVSDWRKLPNWDWFYNQHLDPEGPRRTVPLQMRIWSAG